MALAGAGVSVASARAEDNNCLAAPNGKAPEGSHWHYRTDPATQTKCWFLRPASETAQKAAAQDKPETAVTGKSAAATPKAAPDQAAAAPPPRPAQAVHPATASGAAPRSAPGPWPDPPAQAAAGGVIWPDPARLEGGAAPQQLPGVAAPQPAAATPQAAGPPANDQQEPAAPAPSPDQAQPNSTTSDSQVAAPAAAAASDNDQMTLSVLLALAVSLLVAGIFIRRLVRTMFAPRPRIARQRREPALRSNEAAARYDGAESDWVEQLDGDVQAALRELLRTLERQAA